MAPRGGAFRSSGARSTPEEPSPTRPVGPQLSPLKKTDLVFSSSSQSVCKMEALQKVLNETSKEINTMLSKYAQILSERAAMDVSYVEELDGFLKEASSIENHLKPKRKSLRHGFAVIANTLQIESGLSEK
uniref:Testis expressed 12 n=1 Tax=Sphenodon punctatus TaxID=8508 RepID=A0A8D0L718_SPHPU